MSDKLKRLIDLAGVEAIEQGFALPNCYWAKENDNMPARIADCSIRHFGRTAEHTVFAWSDRFIELYDPEDPYDDDEDDEVSDDRQFLYDEMNAASDWDLHFEVLDLPFDQQQILWTALGWDVTDGAGQPLRCLGHFARALLAHAKGLPLQGRAVEPIEATEAQKWGDKLEAEARRFRRS